LLASKPRPPAADEDENSDALEATELDAAGGDYKDLFISQNIINFNSLLCLQQHQQHALVVPMFEHQTMMLHNVEHMLEDLPV
jgi:hypothetical protein